MWKLGNKARRHSHGTPLLIMLITSVYVLGCNKPDSQTNGPQASENASNAATDDSESMVAGSCDSTVDDSAPTEDSSSSESTAINPVESLFNSNPDGITAPVTEDELEAEQLRQQIASRDFATLQPLDSEIPAELVAHLKDIDQALGSLVESGANDLLKKEEFVEIGLRLGRMKLAAGEKLAHAEDATADDQKAGVLAQLIALSHMSGLGDVESAQQLESLARGLVEHPDPDLSHQSRVVLLGFELQNLQNGLETQAAKVVDQVRRLFTRPADAGFPEFMISQQAIVVLQQMGFHDEADQAAQVLIKEYQESEDPELRKATWNFATRDSQELANYNQAIQNLASDQSGGNDLVAAARGLLDRFPSGQTLEQIAQSLQAVEYAGHLFASQQLAQFVNESVPNIPASSATRSAEAKVEQHKRRLSFLGQPFEYAGFVDLDGQPIDQQQYTGKVVVVDIWATWCIPCINEIPRLREIHSKYASEGLEIVALNIDDNQEGATRFTQQQSFPWKNYRLTSGSFFDSDFAQSNGIEAIPFVVVIGKDGTVKKLHARGNSLETAVRTALGLEASLLP